MNTPKENEALHDNKDLLIGYMSAHAWGREKHVTVPVVHLKSLFNLASKPLPPGLRETQQDCYTLPSAEVASLVMRAAKNQGYGLFDRAQLYLRMRLR